MHEAASVNTRANPSAWLPTRLDALAAWDWPGNIRELRSLMDRLVLFAEADADLRRRPTRETVARRPDLATTSTVVSRALRLGSSGVRALSFGQGASEESAGDTEACCGASRIDARGVPSASIKTG